MVGIEDAAKKDSLTVIYVLVGLSSVIMSIMVAWRIQICYQLRKTRVRVANVVKQ